jgi:two-component system LytT family response regulator
VGEADDVPAAREAIATLAPDLVLLDVQMPSGTGFDVLDGLERVPRVVFVTAYDTYAVRAFRANALDYLVKPVEAPRLLEALQRARHHAALDTEPPMMHGTLGAQDQVFVRFFQCALPVIGDCVLDHLAAQGAETPAGVGGGIDQAR